MKKTMALLLTVIMVVASLTVAVSGAYWQDEDKINLVPKVSTGDITVDGEKENIYNGGLFVPFGRLYEGNETGASGAVYMVHDNEKLYVYVEVVDKDMVAPTDDQHRTAAKMDTTDHVKIVLDPASSVTQNDKRIFQTDTSGYTYITYEDYANNQPMGFGRFKENTLVKVLEDGKVSFKQTDDGYCYEYAILLNNTDGTAIFDKEDYFGLFVFLYDFTSGGSQDKPTAWYVEEDGRDDFQAIAYNFIKLSDLNAFSDVSNDSWYFSYVGYAVQNGLFLGTSETTFEPSTVMTRSMFVRLFANLEGVDFTEYEDARLPFTDVDMDSWYGTAVAWAYENGVVNGTSETTFNPNDGITREQMCMLIYNYMEYKDITLDVINENVDIKDADDVAGWAKDAVEMCVETGLMQGPGDGTINPKGTASRAEVATLITNFCNALEA